MPQDVAAALGSLPLNYDVELEYMQAEYTIDMALPRIKLAVEADGPLHFMRNVPKAIGRTLGKFMQCCHTAHVSACFTTHCPKHSSLHHSFSSILHSFLHAFSLLPLSGARHVSSCVQSLVSTWGLLRTVT